MTLPALCLGVLLGSPSGSGLPAVDPELVAWPARIVDFSGTPMVSTRIEVRGAINGGSGVDPFFVLADEEGRVRVPRLPPNECRLLQFRLPSEQSSGDPRDPLTEHRDRAQGLFGYRDVTTIELGNLGDVMLLPAVPLDVLRLLPDETLRALDGQIPARPPRDWPASLTQRHSLLREMARRGEEWIPFLERVEEPFTREVLLCRARGEPDPIEIEVQGLEAEGFEVQGIELQGSDGQDLDAQRGLDLSFPVPGSIRGVVRNRSLPGLHYSEFDTGKTHLQLVLVRDDGVIESRLPNEEGGLMTTFEFSPGDELPFRESLTGTYLGILPGTFRAKIVHTPDVLLGFLVDWYGLVRVESEEFVVRLHPQRFRVQRSEIERWNTWIDALDTETPPTLCQDLWSDEYRYRGEPTSAEDHLYREGPRVAPVLIDRLAIETDPGRQLAICALLTNLTGFHRPFRDFESSFRVVDPWPTVRPKSRPRSTTPGFRFQRLTHLDQVVPFWTVTRALWEAEVGEN